MVRRTRRHRSHKRSTTLHRRRYGKGRKSGRKCRKTRRMRGGDVDISLAGELNLLIQLFSSKNTHYVKLKTNDEFVSRKYLLDAGIMEYIKKYASSTNPKIVTVTVCDDGNGWNNIPFDEGQFIRDYQSRPTTKSSSS